MSKGYRAAVISLGSKSSKMTIEAMRKYFNEVDDINIKHLEVNISGRDAEVLYEGEQLKEYDCVLAKGSFRFAPLLSSVTNLLQDNTVMPIHETAFTIAHDKLLTHLVLQKHNIPMPRTYIVATSDAAKLVMKRMNFPIIMKFPQGTQGKGVVFADSYGSGSSILDAFTALRQPFILQEFVETGGEDIRAFVVGDKVVAAMKRKADASEKRSNLHAGGVGESVVLDAATEMIAVKTAKALRAEICGVDILQSAKGPLVIEANISPGLQGIVQATGVDVADKIAQHLFDLTVRQSGLSRGKQENKILNKVNGNENILMTTLDFRGGRVLLPEIITKKCKFKDEDMYEIKSKDGRLVISRMDIT